MLARIISGFVLVALGALITLKANALYNAFGPIPWAEQHLGTEGGSRLMYKLVGIGLSILGFLIMTGLLGNILISLLSSVFQGFATPPPNA